MEVPNDLLRELRVERERRRQAAAAGGGEAGCAESNTMVGEKEKEKEKENREEAGKGVKKEEGMHEISACGSGSRPCNSIAGDAGVLKTGSKKATTVDLTLSEDDESLQKEKSSPEITQSLKTGRGGVNTGGGKRKMPDIVKKDVPDISDFGDDWGDVTGDLELARRLQEEEEQALFEAEGNKPTAISEWQGFLGGQTPGPSWHSPPMSSSGSGSMGGVGGASAGGSLLGGQAIGSQDLTGDVCPNAHEMYLYYDSLYFKNALTNRAVFVEWSKRMTLCAGLCSYKGSSAECRIALSEPLLKFRSSTEVKETLLHEMIHAWQFVTSGNRDREDHGSIFHEKMHFINAGSVPDMYRPPQGYKVSVYHSFNDEVLHYKVHWWTCQRCGRVVKRSMNRPPSEKDCREYRKDASKMRPCVDPRCSWHVHVKSCGGEFVKTKEPEPKGKGKMGGTRKSKEEGGHALGGSEQTKVQAKKAKGSEGHLLSVSGPNVLGRGPTKKSKAGDGQVLGVGEGSQRRSILDFFDRTGQSASSSTPSATKQAVIGHGCVSAGSSGGSLNSQSGGQGAFLCPVCATSFNTELLATQHLDDCLNN